MKKRIITVLVFVFIAQSSVYAGETTISASMQSSNLENDIVEVDINLSVPSRNKVSAATAQIKYPHTIVEFIRADKPSAACSKTHKLDQIIALKDSKKGSLTISKVKIGADDQLASGTFCFTTLQFKKKKTFWSFLPWVAKKGELTLSDFNKWELVGPGATYDPSQIRQTAKTTLTVRR